MSFHEIWNSVDKLAKVILFANWGIALTLLTAFACTAIVIKAGSRKDELTAIEDSKKAAQIADTKERAEKLEQSNLQLRGQVAHLETGAENAKKDVATVQKAAIDAKAAQQQVEIHLAEQKERAANAERSLAELQERVKSRTISAEQRQQIIRMLRAIPKNGSDAKIVVTSVIGDAEGDSFARQIDEVLKASGFATMPISQAGFAGGDPIGFGFFVHNARAVPEYVVSIIRAFDSVGIPMGAIEKPTEVQDGFFKIMVGHKPNRP